MVIRFLGIETSCDDTGVAAYTPNEYIFFNRIYKQSYLHKKFKGVVPNVALGEHFFGLDFLIDYKFFLKFPYFFITYTKGPGFIGSLFIGISFSKLLSLFFNISLIGIHHLEGHILSAFLSFKFFLYPFIALLISGGHTFLLYIRCFNYYYLLGCTLDDSVGESFDKMASFLNFGYPGGPWIENFSTINNNFTTTYCYPYPVFFSNGFNFSFSGLKTNVKNLFFYVTNFSICYFTTCSSIQNSIINALLMKVTICLHYVNINNLVIVGGCAANSFLCKKFSFFLRRYNISVYVPDFLVCTDNAAMIALAGVFYFFLKKNDLNVLLDIFTRLNLYNF